MQNREWERDYQALLENSIVKGEIDAQGRENEKRDAPRFRVATGAVWIRVEQSFDVIDISKTGISFFASHRFEPSQHFGITLGKAFLVEATVITCEMVEVDEGLLDVRYRVSCRFNDEYTGMRFLVMLKEMDNLEIGFSSRPA